MKNNSNKFVFVSPHRLFAAGFCSGAVLLVLTAVGVLSISSLSAQDKSAAHSGKIVYGRSYQNDVSPALRDLPTLWPPKERKGGDESEMREANLNPKLPLPLHVDAPDPVIQNARISALALLAPSIPSPILNFDGIPFPGVGCSCAPPDTNGAVGQSQYVQMVNEGYQVFNKTTGASVLGPTAITAIWTGFGGVCELNGSGDPVVLYDHLANRWLISQFAGTSVPTDECVAISQTSDATGAYYRYAFHLGTNFFDYPHLGVWPDGYYMSMNVFNAAGTAFLGPQAFAFDRAKMLAGLAATFVTPGITGGSTEPSFLPSDLDGAILPAGGTANPFVSFPGSGTYKVRLFHADFVTPGSTTFTLIGSPAAAAFTQICPSTRACVPELGVAANLDAIGDRLMFRLAYRKFGDGHEAVVGNYTVSAGGVAGVRWFELRAVTTVPVVFQESTYQPDTTWRWMGSAGMDQSGDLAVGFSASSATINPQIRYAGRLAGDPPINALSQGEATLFSGTGSQTGTGNRWGDYSALTIDPVDDCTFWYTQEYIPSNGTFNWRTRIGNFKFTQCTSVPTPVIVGTTSSITSEGCSPANSVIDPNETVTVSFCVQNGGTAATTSGLTGTLQNTGGVTGASGPQNYGAMAPGATVCLPFTFTATGSCGGTLTATIHFQDGATDLGNVVYTFTLGTLNTTTIFTENFDGVTAPALPAGWVAANASGAAPLWVTSTTTPDTVPNDAFIDDPATVSDKRLDSIGIPISSTSTKVTFRNNYNLESTYDGGVLEVSSPNINAGAFTDVTNVAVGGSFVTGGYNGTVNSTFSNPLAGRQAWTGSSGGYITTTANLGPNVAGQTIKLRFRMGSDSSVSSTGWRVDTISMSSSAYVCCNVALTPALTSAVSRLTHTGVGAFDVNMPLSGTSGVEDRQTSTYSIVLTFSNGPITSGTATVTAGTAVAGSPSFSGNTMTVPLTGVANMQVVTLTVNNVNGLLPSASVDIGFLVGDTNGDRSVNSADIGQTKAQSGNLVIGSNFREDVNIDGNINSSDIGLVKSKSGTSVP